MDNNFIPWDAGNLHDTFHSINIDKPDSVTELFCRGINNVIPFQSFLRTNSLLLYLKSAPDQDKYPPVH